MRASALTGLIVGFTLSSVACADTIVVYVYNHDFSTIAPPGPVVDAVVHAGDTVRWHFLDSGHSSTSVAGIPEVWNSGYIGVVGMEFEHTFTHVGVWWYYCFPHGIDLGNGTAAGMAGTVTVLPSPCYANCDGSTAAPSLSVNDFLCFLNRFAAGDSWANCDAGTLAPVLNVNDFTCFLNKYAAGCP